MVISKFTLQASYSKAQYTGASVVLLGIVSVLLPTFLSSSPPSSTAGAQAQTDSQSDASWSLLLVLSCIPMCLSSVYKEKALGEVDIDVIYLNGWVSVFQFLFSIPLCFPSAQVMKLPFNQIIPNMIGGLCSLLCCCYVIDIDIVVVNNNLFQFNTLLICFNCF